MTLVYLLGISLIQHDPDFIVHVDLMWLVGTSYCASLLADKIEKRPGIAAFLEWLCSYQDWGQMFRIGKVKVVERLLFSQLE